MEEELKFNFANSGAIQAKVLSLTNQLIDKLGCFDLLGDESQLFCEATNETSLSDSLRELKLYLKSKQLCSNETASGLQQLTNWIKPI